MLSTQFVEDLSNKIRQLIAMTPVADVEKNVRALLQGAFTKLELVSREEFEVQAEILRRTREQYAALEVRLNELESRLHDKQA